MLKRTLLTMTALSTLVLVSPVLHDMAMAGQFNKPIRMAGPQMKMRIDTRRLATRKDTKKAALPAVQSAAIQPPAEVMAGPQPEPPTRPKRSKVTNFAKPAPLPKPRPDRPYNEFDEGSDAAGIGDAGPTTERPEDGKLFDEDLIARLPETWGEIPIEILEGFGRGAIDGAFDNPPDPVGPFPPGDDSPGDLAGYDPGDYVQPGGPNDPDVRDSIPSFIGDPRNPEGGNQNQGPTNPSNVINDPRGMASDFYLDDQDTVSRSSDYRGGGTQRRSGGVATYSQYDASDGSVVEYRDFYPNNDDSPVVQTATRYSEENGKAIKETYIWDEVAGMFVRSSREEIPNEEGQDSQPNPVDGGGGIDVAMCGTIIPMYLCMRGAGGSASPDDMLTQPGEETGSIMGSGDGPDLGAEAVTNTGDASWNTTDSRGNGSGGGGGSGMDWRNLGDPDGPEDPNRI